MRKQAIVACRWMDGIYPAAHRIILLRPAYMRNIFPPAPVFRVAFPRVCRIVVKHFPSSPTSPTSPAAAQGIHPSSTGNGGTYHCPDKCTTTDVLFAVGPHQRLVVVASAAGLSPSGSAVELPHPRLVAARGTPGRVIG